MKKMAEGVPPTRWKYYVERQLISLKNRNLRNSKRIQSEWCEQSVFVYRRGLHCHFILFDCIGYLRTSVFGRMCVMEVCAFLFEIAIDARCFCAPSCLFCCWKRILCLEERKSLFAATVARSSPLRTWNGKRLLCPPLSRAQNAPAWKPDPSVWFLG